jgi:hypothetical protein
VGREFGIEVTEDSDANGILHGVHCTRGVAKAEVVLEREF